MVSVSVAHERNKATLLSAKRKTHVSTIECQTCPGIQSVPLPMVLTLLCDTSVARFLLVHPSRQVIIIGSKPTPVYTRIAILGGRGRIFSKWLIPPTSFFRSSSHLVCRAAPRTEPAFTHTWYTIYSARIDHRFVILQTRPQRNRPHGRVKNYKITTRYRSGSAPLLLLRGTIVNRTKCCE